MKTKQARALMRDFRQLLDNRDEPTPPSLEYIGIDQICAARTVVELYNNKVDYGRRDWVPTDALIAQVHLLIHSRSSRHPLRRLQGKALMMVDYVDAELEAA